MKNAKKPSRGKSAKAPAIPNPVEEYLAGVTEPALAIMKQLRAAIRSTVPEAATEVLSYRIPAFKHNRIIVWYAAFSDHCSIFPTAAIIKKFEEELKPYKTSKGTIHFPLDKPLPAALVKKMVKARLAEVEAKKRG